MSSTLAHEGFTKLGADIFLREQPVDQVPPSHPTCILLCTWMDAQPQHIAKYTNTYSKIYPSSTLLLVKADRSMFSKREATQMATLAPASHWLRKSGLLAQQGNRILVHAMSNGGAIQLVHLARLIKQADMPAPRNITRGSPPPPPILPALPARAFIYDSMPGKGTLGTFIRAFTAHLANASFLRKLPYYLFIIPLYGFGRLWRLVRQQPDRIGAMRQALLDPSLLRQRAPRTYIYSREDAIINYDDVEQHVAEARRLSPVQALEFRRSTHVGHVRVDPERYWSSITSTYENAK